MGRASFMQWLRDAQRKKSKSTKDKPRFSRVGLASRVVISISKRKEISPEFGSTVPGNKIYITDVSVTSAEHAGWRFWYW